MAVEIGVATLLDRVRRVVGTDTLARIGQRRKRPYLGVKNDADERDELLRD